MANASTDQRATRGAAGPSIQVRCGFCLTVNRIKMARASDRPRCGSCERPILVDRPLKVAEDDFQRTVLDAEAPVLVDFYADWCGPCKVLAPKLDELAAAETGHVLFAKVDTDHAPSIATRYAIRSVPTVVLFQDGEEVGRSVGIMMDEIKGLLRRARAR